MSAHGWQRIANADSVRVSPVGFRLIDYVSGRAPFAPVAVHLDQMDPQGAAWVPLDVQATITIAGTVAFPGLERRRYVAGLQPRRYRIRVESEYYRPQYRQLTQGVEFQTLPEDDAAPQPVIQQNVVLLPSVRYPYPAHVRTVHGQVRDQSGIPVPDVVVSNRVQAGPSPRTELTLTDDRGVFALALRWVPLGAVATVVAVDQRTQRTASQAIVVPADLSRNQLITIV